MPKEKIELERRWILPALPAVKLPRGRRIRQGYISTGQYEQRIREENGRTLQTFKIGEGDRPEENRVVGPVGARVLWANVQGLVIVKKRYSLHTLEGGPYDLDVHENELAGLIKIERNFATVEEKNAFVLPAQLFPGAVEVSDRVEFTTGHMSAHGLPPLPF